MSDFNLPIIEPTIDYTKVPPINQKRTIAFINHFIIHTVTFLNKFALTCEEKLYNFENKLQRVEASLEILEARLSSIPGLENEPQVTKNEECEKKENEEAKPAEPIEDTVDVPDNNVATEVTKNEETDTQPISADSRYAKYFKMVHFGVPKQAVKLKMIQDGLDSSALDEPNRLVPKTTTDVTDNTASDTAN